MEYQSYGIIIFSKYAFKTLLRLLKKYIFESVGPVFNVKKQVDFRLKYVTKGGRKAERRRL